MPHESLLLGIAQIAIVVAGFTAVTAALTPAGGGWGPGDRIRQRAIVSTSLNVTFESLLPLVVFAWLGDAHAAITIASAITTVYVVVVVGTRLRQYAATGALRSRSLQVTLVASTASIVLFAADAVALGSVAPYALALCLQLFVAVVTFYALVASSSS